MPATYRQALTEHVRFLPFTALADVAGRRVLLRELYLDRALVPHGKDAPEQPPPNASEKHSLADLMREPGARVVLVGEPGAGKTACLYHLALDCASREPAAMDLKHEFDATHPLPLLLRVLAGGATYNWTGLLSLAGHGDLPLAFPAEVEEFLRQGHSGELEALKQELQSGGLVLIDGDTIVEAADGAALRPAIERLVDHYPECRFVVTCRTHMLDVLLPLDDFTTFSLPSLSDQEVEAFIAQWYPIVAQDKQLAPSALAERIAILQGRLRGDEYLRKLVGNPLALAVYVCSCAEGESQLPARAIILRRLLECLLGRHRDEGGSARAEVAPFTALDEQIELLQTMAMAFQTALESSAGHAAALLHAHVEALLGGVLETHGVERRQAAEWIVPQLLAPWQRQGLLTQSGSPPTYQMPWWSLREFLAARALAMQPTFPTYAQSLRDKPHWRDVLPLAIHELAHDSAPVAALAFPRLLLSSATGAEAVRDVLLAAECLIEAGLHAEVGSTLYGEVREHLLRVLNNRTAPLANRIRAGLLLGHLGDPRFVEPFPPVAHVAAGPYLFGSREGYEDEGPQRRVDVPAFAIGIYPVTCQEFARFLASAPEYPRPHYWHDSRFNNPSQPVVGITWDDANTYCRWLTVELRRAGLLASDLVVRLPLEIEWEKAAAWDPQRRVKRRYPWGDEWSSSGANTADRRSSWLTAPVGCYPDGVSAYGVHDMIGNVWEWMANEYVSYPGAQAPFHEEGSYTLRGLSCASLPTHARCTYRSRLPADYWRYHLGFRIVLARPLQALVEAQSAQRQPTRAKHKKQRTP